jgi:hypothetical protein
MNYCEHCRMFLVCRIQFRNPSWSDGSDGKLFPCVEGAMNSHLYIEGKTLDDYFSSPNRTYHYKMLRRTEYGCERIGVKARYSHVFGCYVFLKMQSREVLK